MNSNIFYNYQSNEKILEKKKLSDLQDKNKKKKIVDINKLLNKVKIDEQSERKHKIIFFSSGILLLMFMGLFVSIVR